MRTVLYDKTHPKFLGKEHQLKLGATLVEGMAYLEKIGFIHADINPANLFVSINPADPVCIIIDYDGGAVTTEQKTTSTIGKLGQWMSPQLMRQKIGETQENHITINDDLWSVMLMIHLFLFPYHPLFFMEQMGYKNIEQYFTKKEWPQINVKDVNIREEIKQSPAFAEKYAREVGGLPKEIRRGFIRSINHGWNKPNKRTTYQNWLYAFEQALSSKPIIQSFKTNQNNIVQGDQIILKWDVRGVEKLWIHPNIGEIPINQTEIILQPDASVTYELEAKAFISSVKKSLTIEVLPAPKLKVVASQESIIQGEHVTFTISGDNFQYVRVKLYNGSFLKKKALAGTTVTTGGLKESQQFFFEAVGAKKRVVEESIFIHVYPPVKIESFTADPLEIMQGEEVTLSWEVVHATSVSIPTYGAQLPGKSLRVPPVASGPIELIVEGHVANDQARAQVSVMVYPHPIVHFFEASRSKVLEGEKMEISWKVENARTVYLWDGGKEVAVPAEGKLIYRLYQTTDYVLRVVDLMGNSEARHKYYSRVSVCQPAKLEHFEVLTPKTNHGGEIQLAWEAPHAQEVWLSWNNLDPIEVTSKQGIKLPAYNDTDEPLEITYTLSIVDELGSESISPNPQRATVYPTPFWVIYPPSLVQVKEGQTYTLEAEAHYAQKLFVLEGENTEEIKAGSIRLTPHRDTVYKLMTWESKPFAISLYT
ncbi:MAG: serine/threonine-protein kinase, partial [Bacteroidota bacterium]